MLELSISLLFELPDVTSHNDSAESTNRCGTFIDSHKNLIFANKLAL